MGCINKNLKDNQRLIQDFSETRVNQLFDEYFPNENPSYGEFISNPNVKEALGIIPIFKVKSEIGKAFGKEISSRELKILKKSISDINDKLLGHSYKLFNIKQKGESDNYSWGLRKINSNINIQAKIDRLKQRINTGKQIRNLEDNQFNFPDINQTIKPGVPELFESNPEFSSQIYEALGFKNKLKTTLGKELEYKDPYVPQSRLKSFKQYEVLNENGDNIGTVVVEYRGKESVILHPKLNVTSKGYGKDLYKLISSKFNVEVQEWNEGAIANSDSAKKMWDSLEKEGNAKRIIDAEQGDNFRVLNYSSQITPQQKQQAQQLYSQYLQQNPNGSIEQFKSWISNRNTFDKELAQKIQDKLQRLYPEIKLNITNNPIWEKGDNVFNQEEYNNQVNYRLKATEILLSDKAKQVFAKGEKAGWDLNKILTELQIPKEQKKLIEDSYYNLLFVGKNEEGNDLVIKPTAEELALDLMQYEFNIDMKVSKSKGVYNRPFNIEDNQYEPDFDDNGLPIKENNIEKGQNTQYYSNLTVPGGTNYTENEVSTPLITPSIKGHAQFSTDNGIGWFRSDDKAPQIKGWQKDEADWMDSESAVYNAITPNDKIIWGHPTIGKSFLKEKGDNSFITLDDDYANEVNAFIDKNRGNQTRQEYKGSKPKEYNKFMLDLFDRLKIQAKKEGKKLFVSNTNILKERMSEFDKVITMPKDEFKKRFDKRGSTYGFEDWKSDIDKTVDKVDSNKVIETTKYLSDLLEPQVKTRRILEVQSDLFQKGRDKDNLINEYSEEYQNVDGNTIEEIIEKRKNIKSNQFLQLLNKDNNWVTFFVKSIIQDSAKKGYEKVLFPSGNTVEKIEGFDRITEELEKINNNINKYKQLIEDRQGENISNDVAKLDELNKEKQHFLAAQKDTLSTINFYENTVTNILKKQGYNPELITDEYGNTWNEITINQSRDLSTILLQRNEANKIIGQANIKAGTVLIDAINQKQDTLPHEYAHHYIAWFRDTPIVQEGIKRFGSEEALVQAIGEQVIKQKGEAYNWWKKFTNFIIKLLSDKQLLQVLTDSFLNRTDLNTDFTYNNITPQQKQQATFMFSEFLDVYLQDFEQVERVLKEENVIEKDCTGGGKIKAEKGLQTNFTKGGKWKIYEIFEGKSHKQGGIDINIKNNQISFTNKNGSIKAKYGLVISKENKL